MCDQLFDEQMCRNYPAGTSEALCRELARLCNPPHAGTWELREQYEEWYAKAPEELRRHVREQLRRNRMDSVNGALAELTAYAGLCAHQWCVTFHPDVTSKTPDFLVTRPGEAERVYVEVTTINQSDAAAAEERRLAEVCKRLLSEAKDGWGYLLVGGPKSGYTLKPVIEIPGQPARLGCISVGGFLDPVSKRLRGKVEEKADRYLKSDFGESFVVAVYDFADEIMNESVLEVTCFGQVIIEIGIGAHMRSYRDEGGMFGAHQDAVVRRLGGILHMSHVLPLGAVSFRASFVPNPFACHPVPDWFSHAWRRPFVQVGNLSAPEFEWDGSEVWHSRVYTTCGDMEEHK